MSTTRANRRSAPSRRYHWRVVDIVTASVLAVAIGVVYWAWAIAAEPIAAPLKAVLPGLDALVYSVWLLAGILGGFVIRKPGAALYVELVAAFVEMVIGNSWGLSTLLSGLTQGLGAEIGFALLLYRVWRLPVAWLAGGLAGLGMALTDLTVSYGWATSRAFDLIYLCAGIAGGAFVAGTLAWLLTRALATTGALSRFAAGRNSRLV